MNRFNIRVYGIYIEDERLLVTDEIRFGTKMTKLPGGGLEFGEGIEDCLKREWKEELETEIEVNDIMYANPFFVPSFLKKTDQVICLYFNVSVKSPLVGRFSEKAWDFEAIEGDQQIFRWIPVKDLSPESFTFPIDQAMAVQLRKRYE